MGGARSAVGQAIRAARTAHRWTQAELGERAACDQATVSRVELGRTADPGTLQALAGALGLPLERVGLADVPGESAERLEDLGWRPHAADHAAVAALGGILATRRRAEDIIGPAPMLRPVLADLDLVRELDRHAARDAVRAELGELAAEHAQFLGWMAADLGRPDDAARWYRQALNWTRQPAMTISALSMSSHLALCRGEPADALALAEGAWTGADQCPPGVLALLAQQQARAYATLGDRDETERMLARAEIYMARATERPEDEPPWIYFQSSERLLMQRGVAYTTLGRGRQAVDLIQSALHRLPELLPRDRGWLLARLAHAHAVAGDVGEAVGAAAEATTIAAGTNSAHAWREIKATRRRLARWERQPAVRALDLLLAQNSTGGYQRG